MKLILDIIFDVFDMFVMLVYMNRMLNGKRKRINVFLYLLLFVFIDLIPIKINNLFPHPLSGFNQIIIIFINILAFYIISLLHEGSFKQYIFTALLLEILIIVSDYITTILISIIIKDLSTLTDNQITLISLLCEIILFLIVLVVTSLNKRNRNHSFEYNILLLTTPIISIVLLSLISVNDMIYADSNNFYFTYIICIVVLNSINYIMLENSARYSLIKLQNTNMQQQIILQREKYKQLNYAYRDTRRLIHDTNKHYMAIQEFIKSKDYDKLSGYVYSATESLNNTYVKYNSGNLVIDSFLTYYDKSATEKGIIFNSEININPEGIPLDDYDLCVILGNLLDNALNACINTFSSNRVINSNIFMDDGDRFIIHVDNTKSIDTVKSERDSLFHGYGLKNIQQTVSDYKGVIFINDKDFFSIDIAIPIINSPSSLT